MGKSKKTFREAPAAKRVCLEPAHDVLLEEVTENECSQNIELHASEAVLECIDLDQVPDQVPGVLQKAQKAKTTKKAKNQAKDASPWALLECESIAVYQRYNRLDKLVSDVVDAVKGAINKNEEFPKELPKNWSSNFQTSMVILPSNQIQIIFNGLLNILDEDCISPLEKNPEDTKSVKILSITSQLLGVFLRGVHIADHTVHANRVLQFLKHMNKLHSHLGRLGSALLQKQYDHLLMVSFLGLCLAWGDMHILLINYRPIDMMIERPKLCKPDTTPTNLFGLHSYLANEQWSLIAQRITNFGEGSCKQLLDKLVLQKLSAMEMFDAEACKDSCAAAAKSLALGLDDELIPTVGKDGLLFTNSLDNKQTLALAGRIIQQLKTASFWPNDALMQPGIQENRALILGLLVHALKEIGDVFTLSEHKANSLSQLVKNVVTHFTPYTVEKADMKFYSTDEIFSAIVNEICHCIEKELIKEDVTFGTTEKMKIDYHALQPMLRILSVLPLENLNEHLQTIVLGFCLALMISLSSTCSVDETLSDQPTKKEVEDLFLSLLDGRNSPNITRCLKVGPFLRRLSQSKIEQNLAHSPKLLELLFGKSLLDIRFLESLEVGVPLLLRDGDLEATTTHAVHIEAAIVLLQTINKCPKPTKQLKYRCYQMQRRLGSRLMRFSRELMSSETDREDLLFDAFSATIQTYQACNDATLLNDISGGLDMVVVRMSNKVKEQDARCLSLLSIILGNKKILTLLSENFLFSAWEATLNIKNVSEHRIKLIETMNWEQYKKVINAVLAEMALEFSKPVSYAQVEKYTELWTSVVTARHNNFKCLYLLQSLTKLSDLLLTAMLLGNITDIHPILEFNVAAVNQREERISKALIDFYLESITVVPLPDTRSVRLGLKLLTDIFCKCPAIVTELMPAVLQRYTHILSWVANAGSSAREDLLLEPCAFEIERLAGLIAKHDGFTCWGPYSIIADILQLLEMHPLRPDIKHHFMNAMRCFFEGCDSHHIIYLGKTLTPVSKMMFEEEYGSYIKHHRYVGKL